MKYKLISLLKKNTKLIYFNKTSKRYLNNETKQPNHPTSIPHIGNYFGAIKQWVKMQNEIKDESKKMLISIVDLHAITIPKDNKILNDYIYKCAATLIACGIDPNKTILYQQSQVPYHGQLSWIFTCLATKQQLARMNQFKHKSDGLSETSLGLFNYPILQTADILLFKATHVPVGEDQLQHLELSRDIAYKFNNFYKCEFFPPPKPIETEFKRLHSLRDPTKKMSKSDADKNSRIELTDPADVIQRKLRKAVTDSTSLVSYDKEKRPGVSTLIDIESACTEQDPEEIVEDCLLKSMDTGNYKKRVANHLIDHLKPIQAKYLELMNDKAQLRSILDENAQKASKIANKNYVDICKIVGFL